MNRIEHLLSNLSEECHEVGQRATKAQRFTLGEIQPGQKFTNAERIMHELADVTAVVEVMMAEGLLKYPVDWNVWVQAKKDRMDLMMEFSRKLGAFS